MRKRKDISLTVATADGTETVNLDKLIEGMTLLAETMTEVAEHARAATVPTRLMIRRLQVATEKIKTARSSK